MSMRHSSGQARPCAFSLHNGRHTMRCRLPSMVADRILFMLPRMPLLVLGEMVTAPHGFALGGERREMLEATGSFAAELAGFIFNRRVEEGDKKPSRSGEGAVLFVAQAQGKQPSRWSRSTASRDNQMPCFGAVITCPGLVIR